MAIAFLLQNTGFRKGLSTNNATFRLTHEVLQALNNKNYTFGIFCDLAKDFLTALIIAH
jgi:hypothetical protein